MIIDLCRICLQRQVSGEYEDKSNYTHIRGAFSCIRWSTDFSSNNQNPRV